LGAAAIAGALALATARPVVTTTVALREPPGEVPRTERALAPGPPSSAAPTRTARTSRPGAVPAPILDAAVGGAVGRRGEPPAPAADRPVTELAVEEAKLPSAAPLAAPGRAVETPASLASPSGERPPEAEAVVGMDLSETPPAPGPGARAPEGESVAKRPFDERDVAAALRARRGDIDACVAATPGDAAAARGQSFLLAVVIDPTGKVSDAQIDDPEIEETPLGVCLVRLARAMSFSPFEGQPFRVELALNYGKAE
ncbi:MAG TPA: hypothetical protein VIW03_14605, partial [Anaeromyxobacter sp.]